MSSLRPHYHPCPVIVGSSARESWLRSGRGLAAAAVVVVVGVHVIGNDYNRHHGCHRRRLGRRCQVRSSELHGPSEALKLVRECVVEVKVEVVAGTWAHGADRRRGAEVSIERGKKPRKPWRIPARVVASLITHHYLFPALKPMKMNNYPITSTSVKEDDIMLPPPTRPARTPNNLNDVNVA
ncbi:hypothetical protein EDB89DRAFT_1909658 [Lactarius sanguifluus]|nr:hypothetical protein EDB89DRAFT_1909658 [Lactarius sanguifluus]